MSKQTDREFPGFLESLDKPVKGFRKGVTKRDILKTLTDDDWKRIDEQKRFEQFNKDSVTAKVMLQNDQVRNIRDNCKDDIAQMINHILNLQSIMFRKQIQIDNNTITDELKPGILLTKEELKYEIKTSERMIEGARRSINRELGKLRNVVGSHDVLKNEIMSEQQFDTYVLELDRILNKIGIQLFDDDIKQIGKE